MLIFHLAYMYIRVDVYVKYYCIRLIDASQHYMITRIVPEIHNYNVLPYVGSYIPSAIASGCLTPPASGVATKSSHVTLR